ncbi:MAG: hypothetical protein M0P69_14560 [Bacteroidales bacterium]|nr:hypothetical protein [Bacteroidales bacterium]
MERLFFHNRYDADSAAELVKLDDDVIVYDVFGTARHKLPKGFDIQEYPYMVDRYIDFAQPMEIKAGTTALLEFKCMDYKDNPLTDEDRVFVVTVNNERYVDRPEKGKVQVALECEEPGVVDIEIRARNYLPFSVLLEVSQ